MKRYWTGYAMCAVAIAMCAMVAVDDCRQGNAVGAAVNGFFVGVNAAIAVWTWFFVEPAMHGWDRALDGWARLIDKHSLTEERQ